MGAIEQRTASTDIEPRSAKDQAIATIRTESFMEQVRLALPETMSVERFTRATVTALMQNPDVVNGTDPDSFFQSVIRCAQDGLMPDGNEAALVVFGRKVTYMPMVGGFRKIAADHGWAINAHVVYDNDDFDYQLGTDTTIVHRPPRLGMERGERIGAYAVGLHKDGRRIIEVLDAGEVEQIRQVSRSKDKGPWVEWPDRMWEKTAARRLFKRLPLGDLALVTRVLDASKMTLEQASRELYGPARELEPASAPSPGTGEPVGAGDFPADTPDDRAGEAAASEDEPTPGGEQSPFRMPTAPASDEPEDADWSPTLPEHASDEVAELRRQADEAGKVTVPFGQYAGQTVAEVGALPAAPTWFENVLTTSTFGSREKLSAAQQADFRSVVVAYVKTYQPDVWANVQAREGGQS